METQVYKKLIEITKKHFDTQTKILSLKLENIIKNNLSKSLQKINDYKSLTDENIDLTDDELRDLIRELSLVKSQLQNFEDNIKKIIYFVEH